MRFLFLFLFLILKSTYLIFGQHETTVSRADRYYSMGDSLLQENEYDNSIIFFEKASSIYKKEKIWENYVRAKNQMITAYIETWRFENLLELVEQLLSLSQLYLGDEHKQTLSTYINLGITHKSLGSLDESLHIFHKILESGSGNLDDQLIAKAHFNVGHVYYEKGYYDESLEHYLKSLDTTEQLSDSRPSPVGKVLNSIGLVYTKKGFYKESLIFYTRATSLLAKQPSMNQDLLAIINNNIGIAYNRLGNFNKAHQYFEESLRIRRNIFGDNHPYVAATLFNIGNLCNFQGKYTLALEYFEESLKIGLKTVGENHPKLSYAFKGVALTYFQMNDYKSAMQYYNKALQLQKKGYHLYHPEISDTYYLIAVLKNQTNEFDEAASFFSKAVEINLKNFGNKHPWIAENYLKMGDLSSRKGEHKIAIENYEKSLISNYSEHDSLMDYSNLILENILSPISFLNSLTQKAKSLNMLSLEENQVKNLEHSISTFQICDSLINRIRHSYLRHEDKIEIASRADEIYSNAIKTCYLIYGLTNENKYLEQAFYFSEKGKSEILSESIRNNLAQDFSNLPALLIKEENHLEIDLGHHRAQISNILQKKKQDTVKLDYHKNKIFMLGAKLDSLKLALEKNYPKYYQLKYQDNTLSVDQIQQELSEDEALVSYADVDSVIAIFSITQDNFELYEVPKDSVFDQKLDQYLQCFNRDQILNQPEKAFHQFTQSSYFLHDRLLKPVFDKLDEGVKHLTLIPDGKLSYIPWGLMISTLPYQGTINYQTLEYLFQDYSISYAHSASLLFQDFPKQERKNLEEVTAFAPSYPVDYSDQFYAGMASNFRDEVVPLQWTEPELNEIERYYDGNFYSGAMATEKVFKENAGNSKILHLAMHALMDNENPMQSSLVFTHEEDSLEDGLLHAYELFNMDLSAEMAVLSACNTGIGKLQRGEGVMSLGRAFSYAGCPSIVMSHWSVDDESTAQLMSSFYKFLSQGERKDVAMQLARKEHLASADILRQHPLYWGSFVVVGNTDPISEADRSMYIYLSLFVLLLAITAYFMIRQRRGSVKSSI